ncbi:MAG TPA: RNA-directed DNA polymerase [Fimbriimonas sp.]|nr:RNA-directed DNA polymerase [Fimbriimonas sp.]
MDTIAVASIQWAIEHHKSHGDTDIFPKRQEFLALHAVRDTASAILAKVNFSTWATKERENIPVPKPDGTFRISTFLHPLDSVIYLAALHEHFETIEKGRVDRGLNISFSYRLDTSVGGSLFAIKDSWRAYRDISAELAKTYEYVLVCDIADFYNQIYVHRVENSLVSLGLPPERCKAIENFLLSLNAKNSRGIPVGSAASIVVSEIILDDIDKWIINKSVRHTRYADDFRMFFNSYQQSLLFLEEFSSYLYSYHRLNLQARKTKILRNETYLVNEEKDHDKVEQEAKARAFDEVLSSLVQEVKDSAKIEFFFSEGNVVIESTAGVEWGPYGEVMLTEDKFSELEKRASFQTAGNTVKELLEAALEGPFDLGLARFALGRGAELRTDKLVGVIIERWDSLAPVTRQVCFYLRAIRKRLRAKDKEKLLKLFETANTSSLGYVKRWILWLLTECSEEFGTSQVIKFVNENKSVDNSVAFFKMLRQTQNKQGLNDWREKLRTLPAEAKRAALLSSVFLPPTERKFFVEGEGASDDVLDRFIAAYVLQ